MTCIVGIVHKRRVYIGGDSYGADVSQHSCSVRKDPKVFIRHGIAYGFTSSYRMGQILMHHMPEIVTTTKDVFGYVVEGLIPHYREILKEHGYSTIHNNSESGGTFMIGLKGKLFCIENDFQVGEEVNKFTSVGSGCELAKGALDTMDRYYLTPEQKIKHAIKTAGKFNITVGGPVKIVQV